MSPTTLFEKFTNTIKQNNTVEAQAIIEQGFDVNSQDQKGLTPLHYAAKEGSLKMVMFLVKNGAELDKKDNEWWTPLHVACHRDKLEVVQMLLDLGASKEQYTKEGVSPQDFLRHKYYLGPLLYERLEVKWDD